MTCYLLPHETFLKIKNGRKTLLLKVDKELSTAGYLCSKEEKDTPFKERDLLSFFTTSVNYIKTIEEMTEEELKSLQFNTKEELNEFFKKDGYLEAKNSDGPFYLLKLHTSLL